MLSRFTAQRTAVKEVTGSVVVVVACGQRTAHYVEPSHHRSVRRAYRPHDLGHGPVVFPKIGEGAEKP